MESKKNAPLGKAEQFKTHLLNNFSCLDSFNCTTTENENEIEIKIKIGGKKYEKN